MLSAPMHLLNGDGMVFHVRNGIVELYGYYVRLISPFDLACVRELARAHERARVRPRE